MRRGPLYMASAGLMFAIMITLVKSARAELGTVEVVFWRATSSLPLAYLLARKVGLRVENVKLLLVRCALGLAVVLCFFYAARGLWIADLTLLSQLQPLAIAFLAPLLLGAQERPGGRVWALLLVGLAGCGIILAPDLAIGSIYGLIALCGSFLSAGAHVCLRGLAATDDSRTVVFYFHLLLTVACSIVWLVQSRGAPELPPLDLAPTLIGIGLTATLGQVLLTQAYAEDRAPIVAAARYITPLWAVIIDLVAFAVAPSWNVVTGGVLIVAAGLCLIFLPGRASATTPDA